jgi:TRAP-type mannitol/chloroaromatic compound transport system permease small subunit
MAAGMADWIEAGRLILIGLTWLSPLLLLPLLVLAFPRALAGLARGAASAVDRVSEVGLWLAAGFCLLMALAQLCAVALRYAFNETFGWLEESVTYSVGIGMFLAAAGALKANAHVRVDIFHAKLGPKGKALVDLIGTYVFLFPVFIVLLVVFAPSLSVSWRVQEGSMLVGGIPYRYALNTLMSAFAVMMIAQGWAEALRAALKLRGVPDGHAPAERVSV